MKSHVGLTKHYSHYPSNVIDCLDNLQIYLGFLDDNKQLSAKKIVETTYTLLVAYADNAVANELKQKDLTNETKN